MTDELYDNLHEVAIAATADKDHLQQMTSTNEDLLKVVKEQQKTNQPSHQTEWWSHNGPE